MAADLLTDAQIGALISCAKRVENSGGRSKQDGQHVRRDYLARDDQENEFIVFTRQNARIPDDYSAGLRWRSPSGEEVILVRCNGSSHRHRNALEEEDFVDRCHVHRATERYAAAERRIDTYAMPTDSYRTLAGALHHLTEIANIPGIATLPDIPDLFQP